MATKEKQPDGPIAMMIDIETLALGSDAFITQFGFCVANTMTREYIMEPRNIWLGREGQDGRNIDFNTVRWWMGQDPNVAKGVFETPQGTPRWKPLELFTYIQTVIGAHGPTVWASPAMFDLPALSSLWQGKPWKYNVERDMMTLYKLLDPKGELQPPPNDMGHDAAADAKWQMEYLFNLMARLRAMEHNHQPNQLTRAADPYVVDCGGTAA